MRRAAMSLREAARGLFVFLLSVSAVQADSGWGVTCARSQICAVKGSTVEIHCTFRHPPKIDGLGVTVERTFWFTKAQVKEPEDLRTDAKYAGRVTHRCGESNCTLTIAELRESDANEYRFRFITSRGGRYTGLPGVRLLVTGFSVKRQYGSRLQCVTTCDLNHRPSYIWYKNGQKTWGETLYYSGYLYDKDSVSCAVKGFENSLSAPVCVRRESCNKVDYTNRSICAFKGSSVDISCSYQHYDRNTYKPGFRWYVSEPKHQQQYGTEVREHAGRVEVLETASGSSTLRISELTESDAAHYHFSFTSGRTSLPGTTLTVKDPDLQVQVIWTPTHPTLICHSSCLLSRVPFVWYENETEIHGETSPSLRRILVPGHTYSCAYGVHRSLPVYAPKVASVLVNHDGNILKGRLLNLSCSSDANPPASYAWYKEEQKLPGSEPHLVFDSIQSSDSGKYRCTAENELDRTSSKYVSINVEYAPQTPMVSVSPRGEIEEGSSVHLTCSSDANPAAHYTWYKASRTLLRGPEGVYSFSSISSGDGGVYRCRAENRYGQTNSTSLHLDVMYAPKPPSVSASPSAETAEGSSVNLTCSSDANPAANYTWYKENEDSPEAHAQIFTIADVRAEHGGNYLCAAQNGRGRRHASLRLTVVTGAWKSMATGTILGVFLLFPLVAVFLWIRRHKSVTQQRERSKGADDGAQLGPVTARRPQDDLHYTSVYFKHNQDDAVYSNVRRVQPHREGEEDEEDEEDGVEYTAVSFSRRSSATGTRRQEDGEDSSELYSTVNKN